ncbi:MAG: hypothetical protein FJW40_17880 [Acidobacteria bacterium]|nr:hypothetical protein [Acidobacteriota bacterium]
MEIPVYSMAPGLRPWSIFILLTWPAVAQQKPDEPRALSVYPFTVEPGTDFRVTVRGNGIKAARAIHHAAPGLTFTIENAESETGVPRNPAELLTVRVVVAASAAPGIYPFRVLTPGGVSNALSLRVSGTPVTREPDGVHDEAPQAVNLPNLPAVLTGRIAKRGESDLYALDARAGESITFKVASGLPSIGAPGGNSNGFDPSLTLYEAGGSWFDPKRLNRVAFNDEPLWVLGELTDAHMVHRFTRTGRYYLRVDAFSGQGGPDYGYELAILPGAGSPARPEPPGAWSERRFDRPLTLTRMNELALRGARKAETSSIETYRAGATVKLPAAVDGVLEKPGAADRVTFTIDGPTDLAIELETPATRPPEFNPYARLLDARGEEVATTISVGRGACTGAMTKSLQAKLILPVRDPGTYTVEVRETTQDLADPDFRYRLVIRPQVPHVGQVSVADDHLNLTPGAARTVRVLFDREEDYRGAIAVSFENLPPGVTALAGADFEPDKDPPMHPGKRERYVARQERSVAMLEAAADAPPSAAPVMARVKVRPVLDGKVGQVIYEREIPMMVISKP